MSHHLYNYLVRLFNLLFKRELIRSNHSAQDHKLSKRLKAELGRQQYEQAITEAQCRITKVLNIPYDTITKVQIDYTQEVLDIINLTLSDSNIMYANPTMATYPSCYRAQISGNSHSFKTSHLSDPSQS